MWGQQAPHDSQCNHAIPGKCSLPLFKQTLLITTPLAYSWEKKKAQIREVICFIESLNKKHHFIEGTQTIG